MAKLLSGTRIYGTATVDTQLFVSGSNVASSTTSGALQVVGGVGVGGNLYVGGTIYGTITTATNIAGGTAGQVPYQTAAGATSFYGPGTAGQILVSSGTNAPVYITTSSIYVGHAVLADSATTATTANTSNNLSGGAAGSLPYQSGAGTTAMLAIATTAGYILTSSGSVPQWSTLSSVVAGSATTATNVVIANETATSTVQYVTFVSVSTGSSMLKVAATSGLTYIPNSGYHGIGIATPTAPLHLVNSVNYVVKFQGGTTGSVGALYSDATQLRFGDASGFVGFTALPVSSEATIKTNSTEAVRVDSSQQVGINTTRPNYRLDVRGQTYIGAAPTLPQLILGDTTNATSSTITTNNGDLIFSANGTAEALRITSSKGIAFGGASNYGTSGQLLKSAGNASPTWVDQSTISAGSVANSHTAGTGLSGSTYNGSASVTWTLNTATTVTTAVTALNLAASATLGGSGYLYIGGYNTKPTTEIYPTPFTVNSTGPIAIADNFSGGNVEANIWNTVYPSSYAGTGFRFQQLLTTGTYRDLVFFKNTGAVAFGGISNYGSSGQVLQSNGDSTATWVTLAAQTTVANLSGGSTGQIPYQTGASTTGFSANLSWNTGTNTLTTTGTVQSTTSTSLVIIRTGSISAASWTTTSPIFNSAAATLTDTSTAAAGTVGIRSAVSLLTPTYNATNSITVTHAVNLYVDAPAVSGAVTPTNSWGVYNAGNSYVGGSERVITSLAVGTYATTANTGDILASGNGMLGYSTAQSGARLSVNGSGYFNGIVTATTFVGNLTGSLSNSLTAGNGLGGGTYNGSSAVTFTNNGVTSLVAGTNIAVNASTGAVTVSVTGTIGAATSAVYARALQQSDGTSFQTPTDPRGASGARGTDLAPNTYAYGLFSEFKNSSLYTGVAGNYSGLLTYANYNGATSSTGDPSYSLLFSPQAANSTLPPRLQLRAGIDSTWGKWSDILHSGNHASAAGGWTPNFSGGVRGYANGSFKKDSGNNTSWDAQVYSSEGYSTRVYCSFKAGETSTHIMAGLNSDPTTDAVYTSIDYAWYLSAGSIAIYESGASVYSSGTYSVNDVFTITYDGTNIRYYYNDTLIRTVARAVSGTLYFDSSFYENPCSLTSVAFGSTGVGGATGAALTLSSLGVGTPPSGTAGEIRATNEITAYYSDRRLKTDVRPIANAVDKVVSLNGIIYKSNEIAGSYGYDTTKDIVGLFADEVDAVLPEAVRPAPFDQDENGNSKSGENYQTIQYEKLVPLLVEAIKEQQKQIAQLSDMVNKLANK